MFAKRRIGVSTPIAIYTRVSTKEPQQETSIDAQIKAANKFLAEASIIVHLTANDIAENPKKVITALHSQRRVVQLSTGKPTKRK
jgi:hypothetical protein